MKTENISIEFKKSIREKYFAHFHTAYTDGGCSVADYCEWAVLNGFKTVIFSEHVRRDINFDFHSFLNDIAISRRIFPEINFFTGVECKVLPDGSPDISEEILKYTNVVYIACHAFPPDISLFEDAFKKVFRNNVLEDKIRIWAHPERFFIKNPNYSENIQMLKEMISDAINNGFYIEKNLKSYNIINDILNDVSSEKIIVGFDAHSLEEANNLKLLNNG